MDYLWSEFWWRDITGAHYIVKEVAETLLSNKTALLNVPYDVPWRHYMRAEVENTYKPRAESDYVVVDQIDDSDDRDKQLSVGRFLLQRNGQKRDVINGYRERGGKSIQEYLLDNVVLRDRIIWVKGLTEKTAREWIVFAENYNAKTSKDGLFVLEVPGMIDGAQYNNINVIKYSDYVTDYDVQLLNSFILSDREDLSRDWKQYISNVAAKLCETDAEASAWLICNTNFKKMNPIDALGRMSVSGDLQKRGRELGSKHVLAIYRSNERKELERRLWSAQVRTLFPIVEIEKQQIVSEYYDAIKQSLSIHSLIQYDKQVTDPYDLEVGSLYYLITHRDASGGYLLYIADPWIRGRIKVLRDCRNTIAHSHCCTPEEVDELIEREK